jgi:hypothetical protein
MNLVLRYIPLLLLAILLLVLVRRRAYREWPFFFAYVAFGVTADLCRFISHLPSLHNYRLYFDIYWTTEALYDILGVLVMYEVLRSVLGGLSRARWFPIVFPALVVVGFGLSLAHAHAAPPKFEGVRLYIVIGEIAVRFIEVLVFAGLVALVPLLGLRWRQYPFGIATGFGLYATVMLLTTTKFSDFGTRFIFLWGVTSIVAYSVAVLIWIWFFSVPQKAETPMSDPSALSTGEGELKEYKDALRRMR